MHGIVFEAPPVLCPPVSPGEILSKSGQMQRLVQPCPRVIVKTVESLASMTQLGALGAGVGGRSFIIRATLWSRETTSGATEGPGCALDARACAFDRTYGHNRTRNGHLRDTYAWIHMDTYDRGLPPAWNSKTHTSGLQRCI
eukprot:gene23189-biopygen16330